MKGCAEGKKMTNDPLAPWGHQPAQVLGGTTLAALLVGIAPKKGLAAAAEIGADPRASRIPTFDELATGWITASWLICPPCITFMRWPPAHPTWWA